jgi:serine/threonine-protein kinase RsbW
VTDAAFRRLSLPASLNSLHEFLEFAHTGAQGAGLSAADRDRLDLVLEELLVNVARYAYPDGGGQVEIAYAQDPQGQLLFELSDKGCIFNPLEKAEPDMASPLEHRPVGGLGIVLVRQLVDSLAYRRQEGCNILSFRFPRPESAGT